MSLSTLSDAELERRMAELNAAAMVTQAAEFRRDYPEMAARIGGKVVCTKPVAEDPDSWDLGAPGSQHRRLGKTKRRRG